MSTIINSILIANRGEIASRVIRTCKKMGIRSIAVFSEADRHSLFVKQANLALFIGGNTPSESYLDQEKIITIAKENEADAIHPGYGFLSENAEFARRCQEEGIIFIGPHPEAIESMGSKSKAKTIMQANGVPVVPGYQGDDQSLERLLKAAKEIGFPVLLKATAGGGGKGMRIVEKENEIASAIEAAKRESLSAFGDDELIIEKYIASGRHLEFQIFGDQHQNAIHLLERECTIQRRYQKVIEESPSPIMDENLRARMGADAVKAAKALNYDNAGTVEFIYDDNSGDYYFLEVNTRLQVEHPVTEEITGLDLVQMQIEAAQGMSLTISQTEVKGNGYALECRLYAEDATNDFLPATGEVLRFNWPEVDGLRIETAIKEGDEISIFYDPMIAKIIVWGADRSTAHRKMKYVLNHMQCQGITSNLDFLRLFLNHPKFLAGEYDTHFIEKEIQIDQLQQKNEKAIAMAGIAATLFNWQKREDKRSLLRGMPSGWRNSFYDYQREKYDFNEEILEVAYRFQNGQFEFVITDCNYKVNLIAIENSQLRVEINGIQYLFNIVQKKRDIFIHEASFGNFKLSLQDRFPDRSAEEVQGAYKAPMPSQIVDILVEPGQSVKAGDQLLILTSMKMENTIEASEDGLVEEIYVTKGINVEADYLLLKINSEEEKK